jgi:hypothetical protein
MAVVRAKMTDVLYILFILSFGRNMRKNIFPLSLNPEKLIDYVKE